MRVDLGQIRKVGLLVDDGGAVHLQNGDGLVLGSGLDLLALAVLPAGRTTEKSDDH